MKTESKEIGRVSSGVYWDYICHVGVLPMTFGIFILAVAVCSYLLTEWWVAHWASTDVDKQDADHWIWVLVAFAGAGICAHITSVLALFTMLLLGSTRLHRQMLKTVMHSPLKFFHTNPTGRILNRFSKDMGMQDEDLPWIIAEVSTVSTVTDAHHMKNRRCRISLWFWVQSVWYVLHYLTCLFFSLELFFSSGTFNSAML